MAYSLDTSAFLDGWIRYYAPDVFPSFWHRFDALLNAGATLVTKQVHVELAEQDDGAADWLADHDRCLREIDEGVFQRAQEISAHYPGWADRKRNGADPFVIALAEIQGLRVITGERLTGATNPKRVRIPDICQQRGVPWGTLLDVIRAEGWSF